MGRGFTLLICLLCLALSASAAVPDSLWSVKFGHENHDVCNAIVQTSDGGYALAGWARSAGAFGAGWYDFWLVRTDASGQKLWDSTYGGTEGEGAFAVQQTPVDGGFVLAGVTGSFGDSPADVWLVKTDADGRRLWSRRYGGPLNEGCYSVQLADDGGYVLAGFTDSYGHGGRDFWLLKTDANGDSVWSHAYGGGGFDQCNSMVKTSDGGYALAGTTESFRLRDANYWLVKVNSVGDTLWTRVYGNGSEEQCNALVQTLDGGFAMGGSKVQTNGTEDMWLLRIRANGDSAWSKTYGTSVNTSREICYAMQATQDSSFVLAGITDVSEAGMWDFTFLKADPLGNVVYSRNFGGPERDQCYSIMKNADGGFVLGGYTRSWNAQFEDFWMVKTGADVLITPPGNFSLVSPPNDTTYTAATYQVPFRWDSAANLDGWYDDITYRVFVSDTTAFIPVLTDTSAAVNTTALTWNRVLAANRLHYWKVQAMDKGGWVTWSSDVRTFTIQGNAPGEFHLVTPVDNAMIPDSFTLRFTWTAAPDMDTLDVRTYCMFMSTDSTFARLSNPADTTLTPVDSMCAGGTTILWHETITSNQLTFWKVRATDRHGLSTWSSEAWRFMLTANAPTPPRLYLPDSAAVIPADEVIKFHWGPSTDADAAHGDTVRYMVCVSADSFATYDSIPAASVRDTSLTWPRALPVNHRYWWRVKAYDKHNLFTWSNTWFFDRVPVHGAPSAPPEGPSGEQPMTFKVHQNYPNPFNAQTEISYDLPNAGFVSVKIFNVLGREVETLVDQNMPAGRYRTTFDAKDLPSGIYILRVEAAGVTDLKKMILLK